MSRQLVTHTWCDFHEQTKDEQVPGASHSVTLDGAALDIDLCPECEQALVELGAWLAQYGRPVTKRGRPASERMRLAECPECGKPLKDEKGVMAHMRNMHGVTLAAWRAAHEGGQQAEPEASEVSTTCPECGRSFVSFNGLRVHQARAGHQATEADEELSTAQQ